MNGRMADINKVKTQSVAITLAARNDPFAADSETIEKMHEVRIAVGSAKAAEDTDPVPVTFFWFVKILIEVVVNAPRVGRPGQLLVFKNIAEPLIIEVKSLLEKLKPKS